MEDDFLVFGSDQVIDNMRGRRIAARIAEPLCTYETLYDGGRVVDAAIAKSSLSEVAL